jgi:protein involved in polysaccharide export with SLBB domain
VDGPFAAELRGQTFPFSLRLSALACYKGSCSIHVLRMHPRHLVLSYSKALSVLLTCRFRILRLLPVALLSAALVSLCGCAQVHPPSLEQAAAPPRVNLAPGDTIRMTFSGAGELNQSQKIRADGKLSLPQIGEVHAAGKTIPQLRQELIALYRPQLTNSDVVVTLESGITQVYISGSVGRPGKLAFDRPTTILQALTEAGGINQFGNSRRVQVIRLVNGQEQTQVLNLHPTMVGKTTRPFYVRDGDVIDVPATPF